MIEDIIGTVGVIIIVITYFLLQIEKIQSIDLTYSMLNILGSSMILVSIFENWNFASFLIEFFWILISLIGIYKFVAHKNISKLQKDILE